MYVIFFVIGGIAVFVIHFKRDFASFPSFTTAAITSMRPCPKKINPQRLIGFAVLRTPDSADMLSSVDARVTESVVLPSTMAPSKLSAFFAWRRCLTGVRPVSIPFGSTGAVTVFRSSFFVRYPFLAVSTVAGVLGVSFFCSSGPGAS